MKWFGLREAKSRARTILEFVKDSHLFLNLNRILRLGRFIFPDTSVSESETIQYGRAL